MSKRTFGKLLRTSGLLIVALFAVTWVAFADNVQNDATSSGNNVIAAGNSTTITYRIIANNSPSGDISGCNVDASNPATVDVITPVGVAANPASITFTACGDSGSKSVQFSSSVAGTHNIEHSITGGKSGSKYNNQVDFTLNVNSAPPSDTTPPVITPNIAGTLGNNGWYVSNVGVSWTVTDAESAVTSKSAACDVTTTIIADTAGETVSCTATSAGGTHTESVTIKRDATAPTLNPTVSPNPAVLNGAATASANASDNLSGVASQNCDAVDTSSVGGGQSVNCTATDNAGNQNTANATYSVVYGFVGFEKPVDNGLLNVAKAGQAIPLKFRLVDANGVGVTSLTAVKVTVASLSCSLGMTADAVEEYASGSSGLQNLGDGYYQFNWKTPTNYANSCKTMSLELSGGGTHTADFQFKK